MLRIYLLTCCQKLPGRINNAPTNYRACLSVLESSCLLATLTAAIANASASLSPQEWGSWSNAGCLMAVGKDLHAATTMILEGVLVWAVVLASTPWPASGYEDSVLQGYVEDGVIWNSRSVSGPAPQHDGSCKEYHRSICAACGRLSNGCLQGGVVQHN